MNWVAFRAFIVRISEPRIFALVALVVSGLAWRTAATAQRMSGNNFAYHSALSWKVSELVGDVRILEKKAARLAASVGEMEDDSRHHSTSQVPTFTSIGDDVHALQLQLRSIEVENELLAVKVRQLEQAALR